MMLVLTFEQRRALAPAAWRQRAVTLMCRKPNEGPRNVTASWNKRMVMSLGLIKHHKCLKEATEWDSRGSSMGAELEDITGKISWRAKEWITTVAKTNNLATDTILLIAKGEGNKGDSLKFSWSGVEEVESLAASK